IKARLNSILGLNVKVKLTEPGSLPRFEGMAKHVIDSRKI
ncbi:MAG: hypothetical protein J6T65_07885, partial [Clostridia bacterium]|nr:hypothetical protein [Clostridia bacterium]